MYKKNCTDMDSWFVNLYVACLISTDSAFIAMRVRICLSFSCSSHEIENDVSSLSFHWHLEQTNSFCFVEHIFTAAFNTCLDSFIKFKNHIICAVVYTLMQDYTERLL